MIDFAFDHWAWRIAAFLLGACIGSFLNVVIYRVPLGMSVNHPKRSFCPKCRQPIPMSLNIPLVSWLWLRGKCASCGESIPFRYFGVEALTAVLFTAAWWLFPPQVVIFLWVMIALWVAISFIDADHMIIPTSFTWVGSGIGLVACGVWPQLPVLAGVAGGWSDGVKHGLIGWLAGFCGLWFVVQLGKMAFGKKTIRFEKPVEWHIHEPVSDDDPMCFVIDGQSIPWWDIFSRKSDRLMVDCSEIRIDGESVGGGMLAIREVEIELPDGTTRHFAKIKSLDGMATAAVIPREAMGMGDIHLMGMIGAFFGWTGVFFSLFAASLFAIVAAVIGRVGFGKPLPFGPFLVMGAMCWAFGAWKIWAWYIDFLGPIWMP